MAEGSPLGEIVLVRHADAGDRNLFDGPDYLRPLTPKGEWQAVKIAEYLATLAPGRIVSSRATRCLSTVVPIARTWSLEIEEIDALFEGSDPRTAFRELRELHIETLGTLVACSHGDIIPGIVELLVDSGVPHAAIPKIKKGAIVELTLGGEQVTQMRFIESPRNHGEQP